MKKLLGALLIVAGSLAAYAGELESDNWELVFGKDIRKTARQPTLNVEGKSLSGSTGCNRFTARVVAKRTRVHVVDVHTTRKLCAEEENRTETAFIDALAKTANVKFEGEHLVFRGSDGTPLLAWRLSTR